ncbi:hypothetical protein ACF1AL_36680 [Streptomyces sp. NPDC014801]|uniref:hypothetical protein n=1 Tax=Streptomyces sp. NPDC014801 TaxID=3364916 RepID=UPI0036FD6B8F
MHFKRALAVAATLVALTATAGCGGDGTSAATGGTPTGPAGGGSAAPAATAGATGTAGSDGDGTVSSDGDGTAGSGGGRATEQGFGGELPEASDMDALARHVDLFTSCKEVQPGPQYDAAHDGSDAAWGAQEASDPSWGIKERAVCKDLEHPIALLLISDMRAFQTAAKKSNDRFAVGRNYAVVPVGDDQVQALSQSGLAFLTCDPDFSAPSGHRTEKALVDGCVLSDYFPS